MKIHFTTERLVVRAPGTQDVEFAHHLYANPNVTKYLGDGYTGWDSAAAVTRVDQWLTGSALYVGVVCLPESGAACGVVFVKPVPLSAGVSAPKTIEAEIGWHFHPDYWGQGYALEAAQYVVTRALAAPDSALNGLGLDHLIAVSAVPNTASHTLCDRLGFTDLGLTKRYYDTETHLFVKTGPRPLPTV